MTYEHKLIQNIICVYFFSFSCNVYHNMFPNTKLCLLIWPVLYVGPKLNYDKILPFYVFLKMCKNNVATLKDLLVCPVMKECLLKLSDELNALKSSSFGFLCGNNP